MKFYGLIFYFVLALLAVKSEAGKVWFKEVSGYNRFNSDTGYAGMYNTPVTGLRVNVGRNCYYRVHLLNRKIWLPAVNGNDEADDNNGYAGTAAGDVIDGVAISCGIEYAVHTVGGGWLSPVSGYDINDDNYGYAGILGRAIDAVMIKGKTYATSYNTNGNNDNHRQDNNNNNVNKSELLRKAEKAADYAREHNQATTSSGICLQAVDDALEFGGGFPYRPYNQDRLGSAYMMHTTGRLLQLGFSELPGRPDPPKKGDVCVTESNWKWEHGHIQIYDGENWYSDFKQYNEFVYYTAQPPNHYYRILN